MLLATDLAVLDHADGSVLLVANAINYDGTDARVDAAYADAVARLDAMTADLASPAPSTVAVARDTPVPRAAPAAPGRRRTRPLVERGQGDIRAGESSRSWSSSASRSTDPADALDVYRVLRASNPSPYMYLLRCPLRRRLRRRRLQSPEALVKVDGRQAMLHPIAGHPPARRDAGGGHRARRPSCWPTPRSAPST